jgi:two-component system osmolarity sensor histidine kinase EnvZ
VSLFGATAGHAETASGARPRVGPARRLAAWMPKGLYARTLMILIAPVVLLQSVIAYVFMERHYQTVTRRLSQAVVREIAAVIDIYQAFPGKPNADAIAAIADRRLGMDIDFLPPDPLPRPRPKPFFSFLDGVLAEEIGRQVKRPFWIDTVGRSSLVEIRVQLDDAVLRAIARRNQTYASNTHIFLIWMVGSSVLLLGIAIIFLRNQVRPILRLAEAAEKFGKGREVQYSPRGAREVRQAGQAFLDMKDRVERSIEQRTTMLNGVSHDLRTILTRFKLSLALQKPTREIEELKADVDEMARMLEDYLAFARGDTAEKAVETDIGAMLEALKAEAERTGHATKIVITGDPKVIVRPDAFKRLLANLVHNAARYGDTIAIDANHAGGWLDITIDDDGPGIPPDKREAAFKPFMRLDEARNQDSGGTGLGLAIARDIARSHGGDISLEDSPLGGLRARVRAPA